MSLRRIHRGNTDPSAPTLVKRCEFEPKTRDVDGLSFYRERYTSVEALVNAARSPGDVYIARFSITELNALGLSLEITEGDMPGHVSAPEISYDRFRADKVASREMQRENDDRLLKRLVAERRRPNVTLFERCFPGLDDAIRRGAALDTNPEDRWPQGLGTRVYRLVAELCRRDG